MSDGFLIDGEGNGVGEIVKIDWKLSTGPPPVTRAEDVTVEFGVVDRATPAIKDAATQAAAMRHMRERYGTGAPPRGGSFVVKNQSVGWSTALWQSLFWSRDRICRFPPEALVYGACRANPRAYLRRDAPTLADQPWRGYR